MLCKQHVAALSGDDAAPWPPFPSGVTQKWLIRCEPPMQGPREQLVLAHGDLA